MTQDFDTIRRALSRLQGVGITSLRDAVYLALEMPPLDHTRPLLLVFTDGLDTASWLTEDAVLDTVRRSGVVIHGIALQSHGFLQRLSEVSGGRAWTATSNRQLHELFVRAIQEMRARYVLTYRPGGVTKPGWHNLKVRLVHGRADVVAQPGYFVVQER